VNEAGTLLVRPTVDNWKMFDPKSSLTVRGLSEAIWAEMVAALEKVPKSAKMLPHSLAAVPNVNPRVVAGYRAVVESPR